MVDAAPNPRWIADSPGDRIFKVAALMQSTASRLLAGIEGQTHALRDDAEARVQYAFENWPNLARTMAQLEADFPAEAEAGRAFDLRMGDFLDRADEKAGRG